MSLSKCAVFSAVVLVANTLVSFNANAAAECEQMKGPKFDLPVVERFHKKLHPIAMAARDAKTPDQARAIAKALEENPAELAQAHADLGASNQHLKCLVTNNAFNGNPLKAWKMMESLQGVDTAMPGMVANLTRLAPEKAGVFQRLVDVTK